MFNIQNNIIYQTFHVAHDIINIFSNGTWHPLKIKNKLLKIFFSLTNKIINKIHF